MNEEQEFSIFIEVCVFDKFRKILYSDAVQLSEGKEGEKFNSAVSRFQIFSVTVLSESVG